MVKIFYLNLQSENQTAHTAKLTPKLMPSCPDGGIGRRAGFRDQWPQGRAGSIPVARTNTVLAVA